MNIGEMTAVCEEKFNFYGWLSKARDDRKGPQISAFTVMKCVVEMVLFGQKSLLEVDQCGRETAVLRWHRSKRKMVVSDSTLERSLSGFDLEVLRKALLAGYWTLRREGALENTLPSGRRVRVGIVDGSDFGDFRGCVFAASGSVDAPLDIEMHSKGKELPAAEKLLGRLTLRLGRRPVDIVLGDGLYMSRKHIRQCVEDLGTAALIKTTEEKLNIVEDAEGLFGMKPHPADGIERVDGLDVERSVRYRITAVAGFRWQDIPYELKVARVEEEKLKPKDGEEKCEAYWVITTDTSLCAEDMRELAHLRWHIENNVFKRLNGLVGSKRKSTRKEHVKEAMLLMWFLGLMMLGYWLAGWGRKEIKAIFGAMRYTWSWITKKLFISVLSREDAGG